MLQRLQEITAPGLSSSKEVNAAAQPVPSPEPANSKEIFEQHVHMTKAIGDCLARLTPTKKSTAAREKFLASEDVVRWTAQSEWLNSLNPEAYTILQDMGRNAIGPVSWATRWSSLRIGSAPPIPPFVTRELLFSRCPLKADGTLVKDSHLLVLVPSRVNGSVASIAEFVGTAFGEKWPLRDIHASLIEALPTPAWMLIPKNPLWKGGAVAPPRGYREANAVELFLCMMVANSPEDAFPPGVTYRCASHPDEPKERLAITSLRNLKSRQSPFTLCHHTDLRIPTAIAYAGKP